MKRRYAVAGVLAGLLLMFATPAEANNPPTSTSTSTTTVTTTRPVTTTTTGPTTTVAPTTAPTTTTAPQPLTGDVRHTCGENYVTIRVSNPNPYVVPNTMAQSVAFGPTPVSITANGFVDIKRFLFAVPVGSVENVYSIAQMPTALVTFEGAPINPATYAGTGIAGDYRLPDEGCTQVLGIVVTAQPKVLAATGKTTKPLAIVGMILIAMGVLALEANRQRLHKRH